MYANIAKTETIIALNQSSGMTTPLSVNIRFDFIFSILNLRCFFSGGKKSLYVAPGFRRRNLEVCPSSFPPYIRLADVLVGDISIPCVFYFLFL